MRHRHVRAFRIIITMTLAALTVMLATGFSYATSVQKAKGQVNAFSGAVLRAKASVLSAKVSVLNDNTEVVIVKEVFTNKTSTKNTNKWYYVKKDGLKGYIRSDLIDNISYTAVKAKTTANVNYRVGPGIKMTVKGTLKKGKAVQVYLKATPVSSTKGDSSTWYKVKVGNNYRYICSAYAKIIKAEPVIDEEEQNNSGDKTDDSSDTDKKDSDQSSDEKSDDKAQTVEDDFEAYLTAQGFPETYKSKLRELHKTHPNWVFTAKNMGLNWEKAVSAESKDSYCVIPSGLAEKYRSTDTNSYKNGKYVVKCGGGWYNANTQTIAYYMDPRNFLNEDRIYMFEQLSYNSKYQTEGVVSAVLSPSKLIGYGFTANLFVNAGAKYDISPIHLATRARQENGSGSDCVNGTAYKDEENDIEVVVYNPFNIHATGSNPVQSALKYAYEKNWTTQEKAIDAGAKFLASGYIAVGQDTLYLQKFYFNSNGAATHQYMQNLLAPYLEANSTKKAYVQYGISDESLTFVIPVYDDMPDSTELP